MDGQTQVPKTYTVVEFLEEVLKMPMHTERTFMVPGITPEKMESIILAMVMQRGITYSAYLGEIPGQVTVCAMH